MLRTRVLGPGERRPSRPVLTESLDLAARLPRLILEARRVSASTLPIWVLPPWQSILPISRASCAASEPRVWFAGRKANSRQKPAVPK